MIMGKLSILHQVNSDQNIQENISLIKFTNNAMDRNYIRNLVIKIREV